MLNKCFSMLGDVIVNKAAHGFVPCHPETLRDPCADKVVPLKLLQISEREGGNLRVNLSARGRQV
jgi:hypothetical protein